MPANQAEKSFEIGDLVKVADDYATGYWLLSKETGEYGPIAHLDRGKSGYVCSVNSRGDAYGLEIEGDRRAWYDEWALSLVEKRPVTT